MPKHPRFAIILASIVPVFLGLSPVAQAQDIIDPASFETFPVVQADVSPRLSELAKHVPPQAMWNTLRFLGRVGEDVPGNGGGGGSRGGGSTVDPALQSSPGITANYRLLGNVTGVGVGFPGFVSQWAPPDTNMAVGITHSADSAHDNKPWGYYVQWVNTSFAVFDKTNDSIVVGPVDGNALFAGFNNGCATNNDGDPIVQYDRKYDRWIFTQFSISTKPYLQCIAISTGPDPQGPYYRYAINFGNGDFPDYPKMGIWPTGYFFSFNIFRGSFRGPKICAMDRDKAVVGTAPTVVCTQLGASAGSLSPADQDGATDPAFDEVFMGFSTNALNVWKFKPNFTAPSSSTVTGPSSVSNVKAFTTACSGGACIPQPGTSELLDSLADRLMYRLAYRHVGGTDYLVVNHSVNPNQSGVGVSGVRWYSLIVASGGGVTVDQQGTYAIDGNARWMGSVAMDKCGDIGVGYSISGKGATDPHPSIRFAGRGPNDSAGQLEAEILLVTGLGSQTSGLNRWGDYSTMRVDPSGDKTFYYTTEYLQQDGTFNWSTAISKVQFTHCD